MKSPVLIEIVDNIDPLQDRRWVLDGENQWFLPCSLDLSNKSYSGYWYTSQCSSEAPHYHTGISQIVLLRGKILLLYNSTEYSIEKNQICFIPPNTLHSGKLMPDENGFLCFGTIVGTTDYGHEMLDVETYHDAVKSHYIENNIPFDNLINQFQ